jgi:site-specific DNA recombinase
VPRWSARPWSGCGDLVAHGCVDVVLCHSADRLVRKFAYQALLVEEFARAGAWVEFVNRRDDSPQDQLLIQFQGMFAEYGKGQLIERYLRGKAYRARSGSVNALGRRPVRPPVRPQDPEAGARYEAIKHEAVLVAEMLRATPTAPSSLNWPRRLTSQGVPTRTDKHCWDRSLISGACCATPAYATALSSARPRLSTSKRITGCLEFNLDAFLKRGIIQSRAAARGTRCRP